MVQSTNIRNSSGTHAKLISEKVAMTGDLENCVFMRNLIELDTQVLLFNAEDSTLKASSKEGAEDNVYSILVGTVNVTSRDPKTGSWYTNLSGKNTPAYVIVRQDDPTGSFFQKLATQRRNQAMHRSFAAAEFTGMLEITPHSVSLVSHNGSPALVIEADFVHGRDGSRWAVVDFPYGDAMQEAIASRRKTSDDSPEVVSEPEPAPPAKPRKARSSRKSTPKSEMEAAIS